MVGVPLAWLRCGNWAACHLLAQDVGCISAAPNPRPSSLTGCSYQVPEAGHLLSLHVLSSPASPPVATETPSLAPALLWAPRAEGRSRRRPLLPAPSCSYASPPGTRQEAWHVPTTFVPQSVSRQPPSPGTASSAHACPSLGFRCAAALKCRASQLWQLQGCWLTGWKPRISVGRGSLWHKLAATPWGSASPESEEKLICWDSDPKRAPSL